MTSYAFNVTSYNGTVEVHAASVGVVIGMVVVTVLAVVVTFNAGVSDAGLDIYIYQTKKKRKKKEAHTLGFSIFGIRSNISAFLFKHFCSLVIHQYNTVNSFDSV